MDTIGLIMAYDQASVTTDPYLGACLDGVLYVSKQRHQKTVIFTEDNWESTLPNLPSYCDGHCDGLLLIIPRAQSEIVPALAARNDIPFVLVGDSPEPGVFSSVDVDNAGAAAEAVTYLVSLGHRKIAAFCGNPELRSNTQRLDGYRAALDSAGICYREDYVFSGQYRQQSGYDNAVDLLARFSDTADRPTALFCFNDAIARGSCDALAEQSLRIPEDVSVIGFDDSIHAISRKPLITTMRQNVRGVGECAANLLLDIIDGRLARGSQSLVPGELIMRETSGPPPTQ
jgi:DNA-binding LacI/PurR family transcriptional regulator